MSIKNQNRKSNFYKATFITLVVFFVIIVFDIHLTAQETTKTEPDKLYQQEIIPPDVSSDGLVEDTINDASSDGLVEDTINDASADAADNITRDSSTDTLPRDVSLDTPQTEEESAKVKEIPIDPALLKLEDRLLKQIKQAYKLRDMRLMQSLKSLFMQSFSKSKRLQEILDLEASFYYKDPLNTEAFEGNFVEISHPSVNSWEELDQYFQKLSKLKVKGVYWPAVQFAGEPVLPFVERKMAEGLFFEAGEIPQVNNSLAMVVELAHKNALKIYATLPMRNHPWLLQTHPPILDEVYDPINKKTVIIPKLDLINLEAFKYFRELLDHLLKLPIDGVVLEDDYTYNVHEGFSPMARLLFEHEKGKRLNPVSIFEAYPQRDKTQMHVTFHNSYRKIAEWKLMKSHSLVMKIIQYMKKNYQDAVIAIETTAEMLMDSQIPLLWYATDMRSISSLPVDYFILNWRKYGLETATDPYLYEEAVRYLNAIKSNDQNLELRIPLGEITQYRIKYNAFSDKMMALIEKTELNRLVIGPVSRINQLDFWTLK